METKGNRMKYIFTLAMALTLSSITSASAQESQEEEKPKYVERIEVTGKKPLTFYRRQFLKTEKSFIKEFNNLIDDKDFKITCRKRNRETSRIKTRVCTPAYTENLKSKFVTQRGDLVNFENGPFYADYKKELDLKAEEHKLKTAELIQQSPELAEKFWAYHDARKAYAAKQQETQAKK